MISRTCILDVLQRCTEISLPVEQHKIMVISSVDSVYVADQVQILTHQLTRTIVETLVPIPGKR